MKEINELKDRALHTIIQSSAAEQVVNALVAVNEEYSYRDAYRKLQQSGLFSDRDLRRSVIEAGFLLAGIHEELKKYISDSFGKDSEFDSIRFVSDIRNEFIAQLKTGLQSKQQATPTTELSEQTWQTEQEQSTSSDVLKTDIPFFTGRQSAAISQEVVHSRKFKREVEESSDPESHVRKLKNQRVFEAAAEFILRDKDRSEQFKNSCGVEMFNSLKALNNSKTQ